MHATLRRGLFELGIGLAGAAAATALVRSSAPAGWRTTLTAALWLLLAVLFAARRWWAGRQAAQELRAVRERLDGRLTECAASLAQLRSREGFYHDILEDIPEMVCRWQPDGRITYVNEAYCRYFGLSREALLRGARLPAFHPGAEGGAIDPEPYRERPVVVVEFPVPQPDGSVRWQRWLDRALFDADGAIREFQSIGEDITERKRTEDETRRLLEENRRLARMALAIQEDERARLARELHDELGQSLTAMRADAESILRLNQQRDRSIDACARAINDVAGQVYGTVHEMMHRLRPVLLDDLGLRDALVELMQRWQGQHPEVALRPQLEAIDPLPQAVQLAAFRIVQEALTNIAKHASAQRVDVILQQRDRATLALTVRDDGVGMEPAAHRQGYGLLGMRERVLALGGNFEVTGAAGHGVAIRVLLPLTREERSDEQ